MDVVAAVPGGGYTRVSGSGIAAAEVAGVVALLWAVNPDLTGDLTRTRALLLDTATPIPASPACTGRMDAPARLVNADAAVHAAETG